MRINKVTASLLLPLVLMARCAQSEEPHAPDSQGLNSLGEILQAEEGAPALLGVVKLQNDPDKPAGAQKKKVPGPPRSGGVSGIALHSAREQDLLQRETRLKAQVAELTATVAALNTRLAASVPGADLQTVRQALDASRAEAAKLQQQTASQEEADKKRDDQSQKLKAVTASLDQAKEELTSRQQQLAQVVQEKQALTERLEAATRAQGASADQLAQREKELADVREALDRASGEARTAVPKSATEIRDYAVGASLAADALSLLRERAAEGVSVSQDMALAGIRDSFAGKLSVPQAELDKALANATTELDKIKSKNTQKTESAGEEYRKRFAARAGVQKDDEGILYRVDYPGDGAISDTDIVSLVVTESLPDGTVIKDMEASGKFIRQPLNTYPPLFRKAIQHLKNHGSLTMVVPPALAYGDAGYPPLIPPGATMVYAVRIRDAGDK